MSQIQSLSLRSEGVAWSGAFHWVYWRQPKRKKKLAWEATLWTLVEHVPVHRPKHSVNASALTGTLQLRYRHELLHFHAQVMEGRDNGVHLVRHGVCYAFNDGSLFWSNRYEHSSLDS